MHSELELKDRLEKAISIHRAQAERELDYFYEGGEADAIFVAKTLFESIQEIKPQFEAMKQQLAFFSTPYTDEDGVIWQTPSAEQHAQVCKAWEALKIKISTVKEAVLICAKAVSQ